MWFVKNMAIRLSRTVLRCAPILLFAAFLPAPYNVSLPPDLLSAVLFIISMTLGFLVLIAFSMLIYMSAFFTISSAGIRILASSLMEFLAGGIIPLPFFPAEAQLALNALPFASMQNTPFLIYAGHLPPSRALPGIGLQLFWLICLILIGRFTMNRATKKVIFQGG